MFLARCLIEILWGRASLSSVDVFIVYAVISMQYSSKHCIHYLVLKISCNFLRDSLKAPLTTKENKYTHHAASLTLVSNLLISFPEPKPTN